ncbi:MAG: nitronate monooxygenase, partial [Nocardiopsaceae bacterium]|nr:nitronate monooxygenase [Nocardiopsaceae bacterium]
ELGADVIVAQGIEAGGHGRDGGPGGGRGTMAIVPAVVDLVDPIPVLAAGGVADGRGLAAALALGAAGALIGTRFQASAESLADPVIAKAIVEASGEDTERGRVLDVARGADWPERYPGRALRNDFLDTWRGKETELATDAEAKTRFAEAADRGDLSAAPVWAGEAAGLITGVGPAEELVGQLAADAETALARVLR